MNTPAYLTTANRLRHRANLLRRRSGAIVEHAPADQLAAAFSRALRIHERAARAELRANLAIQGYLTSAA